MKKFGNYVKISNYILASFTFVYIFFFFFTTGEACARNDLNLLGPVNTVTSWMFFILGIVFFTVGTVMNLSLRKHFPDFYNTYRCLLWTATILLTLPLFVRSVKDYEYYHNEKFATWYSDHFVIDNTVYAILSTVLPIATQTASLVFGLLRSYENESKTKKGSLKQNSNFLNKAGSGAKDDSTLEDGSLDDSTDSEEDKSYKPGYFDPPIERFAFVSRKIRFNDDDSNSKSNMSRSIMGSQLIIKTRKKKRSAGTGNDGNSASDNSDNSDINFGSPNNMRGSIPRDNKQQNKRSRSLRGSCTGDKNLETPPYFPGSES